MSYADLHFDAKITIARTSIAAWNALMRADPEFGRYALSDAGRSAFLAAFTVVMDNKWRVAGRLHRLDGPAYAYVDDIGFWYARGELHRAGGQPAITFADGTMMWYERGELHRIGGPARVVADGVTEWYERGRLHRIGGPARIFPTGYKEWYEYGNYVAMADR